MAVGFLTTATVLCLSRSFSSLRGGWTAGEDGLYPWAGDPPTERRSLCPTWSLLSPAVTAAAGPGAQVCSGQAALSRAACSVMRSLGWRVRPAGPPRPEVPRRTRPQNAVRPQAAAAARAGVPRSGVGAGCAAPPARGGGRPRAVQRGPGRTACELGTTCRRQEASGDLLEGAALRPQRAWRPPSLTRQNRTRNGSRHPPRADTQRTPPAPLTRTVTPRSKVRPQPRAVTPAAPREPGTSLLCGTRCRGPALVSGCEPETRHRPPRCARTVLLWRVAAEGTWAVSRHRRQKLRSKKTEEVPFFFISVSLIPGQEVSPLKCNL